MEAHLSSFDASLDLSMTQTKAAGCRFYNSRDREDEAPIGSKREPDASPSRAQPAFYRRTPPNRGSGCGMSDDSVGSMGIG